MADFLVYATGTGRILRAGYTGPESQVSATGEAQLDETGNGLTHYVSGGSVTARPANGATLATGSDTIASDGIDTATIESVPTGSTFRISGPVYATGAVTGSALDFTTDTPGVYAVEIYSFPELDGTFEVTAT